MAPGAREQWQHFVTIFTLPLAQHEAFGSPPLAEGISYFITSRQDNLSNFAWKKSLTKSSKATIMPDEAVIEFAFLLLSWLSLCWFEFYFFVVVETEQQNTVPELIQTSRAPSVVNCSHTRR